MRDQKQPSRESSCQTGGGGIGGSKNSAKAIQEIKKENVGRMPKTGKKGRRGVFREGGKDAIVCSNKSFLAQLFSLAGNGA